MKKNMSQNSILLDSLNERKSIWKCLHHMYESGQIDFIDTDDLKERRILLRKYT